jgi:hypothetical protein
MQPGPSGQHDGPPGYMDVMRACNRCGTAGEPQTRCDACDACGCANCVRMCVGCDDTLCTMQYPCPANPNQLKHVQFRLKCGHDSCTGVQNCRDCAPLNLDERRRLWQENGHALYVGGPTAVDQAAAQQQRLPKMEHASLVPEMQINLQLGTAEQALQQMTHQSRQLGGGRIAEPPLHIGNGYDENPPPYYPQP